MLNEFLDVWSGLLREEVQDPVLATTIRLIGDGLFLTTVAGIRSLRLWGAETFINKSARSRNGQNVRSESTTKTVRIEIGEVTVQVARNRQGTFEPVIVPKNERWIVGFDEDVISLYSKGMTTGDIQAHLSDVAGRDSSRELVSKVIDRVLDDMQAWHARPFDSIYPVILTTAGKAHKSL